MKSHVARMIAAWLLAYCFCPARSVDGQTTDWVVYSNWSPGDRAGRGASSTLTVDTTIELLTGSFPSGTPRANIAGLATNPVGSGTNSYTLIDRYTNPGGFPAGGIYRVNDLEPGSSVTFNGFVNETEVDVNWSVEIFESNGLAVPLPTWSSATDTLFGNVTANSSIATVAILTTDIALDTVILDVITGPGDGISFLASSLLDPIPGDFDGDRTVDGHDFLQWQREDGTEEGLAVWGQNFGQAPQASLVSPNTIPEPGTMALVTVVVFTAIGRRW